MTPNKLHKGLKASLRLVTTLKHIDPVCTNTSPVKPIMFAH